MVDWCSALCDVQVGLVAAASQGAGPMTGEEGGAVEEGNAVGVAGGSALWSSSASASLSLSLSLLRSVASLLVGHFVPVAQLSRPLLAAVKALQQGKADRRRGREEGRGGGEETMDGTSTAPPLPIPSVEASKQSTGQTAAFQYRVERWEEPV